MRQLRDKNCLAAILASRHQDASPGPLGSLRNCLDKSTITKTRFALSWDGDPGAPDEMCFIIFSPFFLLGKRKSGSPKGGHLSGGANYLPKFLPISFFRRVSRFIGVSRHLALQ